MSDPVSLATVLSEAPATNAPIPMLDLSREFLEIRDEVMAAIEDVCLRQQFVLGPAVERFEQAVAAFCGGHAAIGCASGTDALWLALASLEIGPGDRVITSPFSFFATVSSILRAGAQPILADIEPDTFNLAPSSVEAALEDTAASGARIKALMPVHLYGQCADMDAINALADSHSLFLVEDAAQAFGAVWQGHAAGSLGATAAFSFYPTKNLSAFGDAGMMVATNAEAGRRARALRNHGMTRRYFHDDFGSAVGWNSRLDGIQAAVLEIKLRRLPQQNERRREIAGFYDRFFTEAGLAASTIREGVVLPFTDPRATHIFHQYVVRVPRRDDLRAYLAERSIGSEVYYPLPLHLQESLRFLGYQRGDFPVAERAAEEVLALPIYPELREDEVKRVVETVRAFYA